MSLAVRPVPPFDLPRSLAFLRGFSPMRGEQTTTATSLTKALSCDGCPVVVQVRQKGDRERPTLDVDLVTERPPREGVWRSALEGVRALLSADEDLEPFYAQAGRDPAMAPLVAQLRGMHHVRFPGAFEAAVWAVINQRMGLQTARAMKDRLVQRAGTSLEVDGVRHWAFPEPAVVASLGEAELGRLLPGGRRARATLAVARAFASVDAAFLREAPLGEVRAWLTAIHGVGPFTSSFVLFRGLGRFDGAALISPALVQAAERRYGRSLTARDVARMAEGYGAWGGHWMLYLWASTFPELCPTSSAAA